MPNEITFKYPRYLFEYAADSLIANFYAALGGNSCVAIDAASVDEINTQSSPL